MPQKPFYVDAIASDGTHEINPLPDFAEAADAIRSANNLFDGRSDIDVVRVHKRSFGLFGLMDRKIYERRVPW